ncbi:MAG: SCO family protein [Acetobacteraceae bacterium]
MKTGHAARRRQRDRRGFILVTTLGAALLLLTSGYMWLAGVNQAPRPAVGGPFALTQDDGRPVTDQSFRGKYLLIYFGYTACRDVCPLTLASVTEALDVLGAKADAVQPLFITVDPQRDTAAVMHPYVAAFTPRLIGLTGAPEALRRVAREYRVSAVQHAGDDPARYLIDHSSVLYLVGPDGRYLAPIRADSTGTAMAQDLARYLS